MIVRASPPEHANWIATRAGFLPSPNFRGIEVVDVAGRIHGMAGFDNWTPNSVVVTIALDNPAAFRHLVHPIFIYAFIESNRGVLIATVCSQNKRSMKLTARVGFKELCRIKDAASVGDDLVVFEMRRENCKWIWPKKEAA